MTAHDFKKYFNHLYRTETTPLINGRPVYDMIRERHEKQFYRQTMEYSVLEHSPEAGLYERIFASRHTKRNGYEIQEVMIVPESADTLFRNCYYNPCGMSAGFHVYGYGGKGHYDCCGNGQPYMADFDFTDIDESKVYRDNLFDINGIAALDPSLKYCAYQQNYYINAIDYIRLYRKYPVAEMLMKLELYRMITEKALRILTDNKAFRSWLFRNAETLKQRNMAFRTAFNAFKKNPAADPEDYYKSLMYRIQCGREIAFTDKHLYERVIKYTTQERLADYLRKNSISAETYGDYLTACSWLKLDFSDTKVLFPKDFRTMHDDYTAQYAAYNRKLEDKKNTCLNKKMQNTAAEYGFLEWTNGSYQVINAKSKSDLINEGDVLQHCVGRMDYDKRQAEGKSIICFVRKCTAPQTPYVTVELALSGSTLKIKQDYGFRDAAVPEVQPFLDEWLRRVQRYREGKV
jgi:hypothetical protein